MLSRMRTATVEAAAAETAATTTMAVVTEYQVGDGTGEDGPTAKLMSRHSRYPTAASRQLRWVTPQTVAIRGLAVAVPAPNMTLPIAHTVKGVTQGDDEEAGGLGELSAVDEPLAADAV